MQDTLFGLATLVGKGSAGLVESAWVSKKALRCLCELVSFLFLGRMVGQASNSKDNPGALQSGPQTRTPLGQGAIAAVNALACE